MTAAFTVGYGGRILWNVSRDDPEMTELLELALAAIPTDDSPTRVRLLAPNEFSAQWVRDNHRRAIEAALTQVTGSPCEIVLAVSESESSNLAPYEPPVEPAPSAAAGGIPISDDTSV